MKTHKIQLPTTKIETLQQLVNKINLIFHLKNKQQTIPYLVIEDALKY